jgi:glycosyltransferase involved in cell wall biosynthesis
VVDQPQITVVIPAFNEERALPSTLNRLAAAQRRYVASGLGSAEIVVVDNASTDGTGATASSGGARVVIEPRPGVAFARNAGAAAATAPWLFFVDADTHVPSDVLIAVHRALSDQRCLGGAPATRYEYRKRMLRPYMAMWKVVARVRNMTQGVGQFVTADAFRATGGYPTCLRMAEDTEFNRRLRKLARQRGGYTTYLEHTVIVPSSRRLDEWPVWRTVLMTNPVTTQLFLRSDRFWAGWRERSVR